jgi:hypothetical protein
MCVSCFRWLTYATAWRKASRRHTAFPTRGSFATALSFLAFAQMYTQMCGWGDFFTASSLRYLPRLPGCKLAAKVDLNYDWFPNTMSFRLAYGWRKYTAFVFEDPECPATVYVGKSGRMRGAGWWGEVGCMTCISYVYVCSGCRAGLHVIV